MTPAINIAKKNKISYKTHEYEHDPVSESYGLEAPCVSPLGQMKKLKTFIDDSAQAFETILVSADRRGLEIELSPVDLKIFANGAFSNICS